MKKVIPILGIILMAAFSTPAIAKTGPGPVDFFHGSYDNMLREAKKGKKPILLEFWAGWCGPCKKLEAETFSDKRLAQFLNENFVVYRLDIDSADGMEIVEKFHVEVFPSLLILDHYGNLVSGLKGFYSAGFLEKTLKNLAGEKQLFSEAPIKTDIVFNK